MKKITLTESDLVKIIQKVIKEQVTANNSNVASAKYPWENKKPVPRTYDKMVIDCLTKSRFTSVDTGGKYEVFMKINVSGGAVVQVTSQQRPELFNVTKSSGGKVLSNANIDVSKLNCQQLMDAIINAR